VQRGYVSACERLANMAIGYDVARNFVAGMLATGDKLSKQGETLVEDVLTRFKRGIGNVGETRYDLFNAFTEKYTHESARKEGARFGASLMGKASDIKRNALKALKGDDTFDAMVRRGRLVIDATYSA